MKVTQQETPPVFKPVIIVLETYEELSVLKYILESAKLNTASSMQICRELQTMLSPLK